MIRQLITTSTKYSIYYIQQRSAFEMKFIVSIQRKNPFA